MDHIIWLTSFWKCLESLFDAVSHFKVALSHPKNPKTLEDTECVFHFISNLYKGHALANPGSSIELEYNYIGRPLKLNWHTLNPIKNVHILKVPPVKTRIYDGGRF